MALKKSCEGINAPDGWQFQDCKEDLVTIVRTKKKGDWEVDYQGDKPLKDYYVNAWKYGDNTWEVTSYDPVSGHSGVTMKTRNVKDVVHEVKCTALSDDIWEESSLQDRWDKSVEFLRKCRDKHGITVF